MNNLTRLAPWINRLVLLGATLVFSMIGLRYITDPVHAAAATGVSVNSALAATTTRVGSGAFPLGLAIFTFACLISTRRFLVGVSLIATVVTTTIVVRIVGIVADGPAPDSTKLFIPEGIMLILAVTALLLETARRRNQHDAPAMGVR